MQDTPKTPALSRTRRAYITYRECGVVTGHAEHVITLTRAYVGGPITAEVDGEASDLDRAVRLLRAADRTEVLSEVLAPASEVAA